MTFESVPMKQPMVGKRKAQIAITGTLGSGKSTVAKSLKAILGWKYYSTGAVQRQIAESMGISTLELNRIAETDKSVDERVDAVFKSLSTESGIVVDSRMAWHFMPDAFKVRLVATPEVAAARVLLDANRDAEKYADVSIATSEILARAESERRRFLNTYGVDVTKIEHYDLIVDTSILDQERVTQLVLCSYIAWRSKLRHPKCFVGSQLLIPTQLARTLSEEAIVEAQSEIETKGLRESDEFPLDVISFKGAYLILNGHHRICACIRCGMDVLPVALHESTGVLNVRGIYDETYIKDRVSPMTIHEWEDACGFRFSFWPTWLKKPVKE
jgi:cytidylate kinase